MRQTAVGRRVFFRVLVCRPSATIEVGCVMRNKLTSNLAIIAGGMVLSSAVLAQEAWTCASVTFLQGVTAVNDEQCVGSLPPPSATLATVNAAFAGDPGYSGFFKDDDATLGGSTTFAINAWGTGNGQGSITFNVALTDSFVLELKFGQGWSLFRFDDDVTSGTTWTFALPGTLDLRGLGLSHASISTVTAIPEPKTYALMLAGLAAIGFMARRRRPD